jgi:ADP-ribosyl-[dinitrogen reductase] hydrolase
VFKIGNSVRDALIGLTVGDALGVPVEFTSREALAQQPVTDMRGYGTHHQPPGTWSDDGSLTLCLAESLCHGYNLRDIAEKMVLWAIQDHWTARGTVFDIGSTTNRSIRRLAQCLEHNLPFGPIPEAEASERDNGNGSLMRILPLAFYLKDKPLAERWPVVRDVSGLTHGHVRAEIAGFIYISLAIQLLNFSDPAEAYAEMQKEVRHFFDQHPEVSAQELSHFDRILNQDISCVPMSEIDSSGYVVHTLEASLWCLLTSHDYAETVLKAVNLGLDTDTTGAVTGGLAGIVYGMEDIPTLWVAKLARKSDIMRLADVLNEVIATAKVEVEE